MKSSVLGYLSIVLALLTIFGTATRAVGSVRLRSICRVKGQEENTIHGLGIVVGLNGTGDGGNFLPSIRSLATMMELMGTPIGSGGARELKDVKNVALVTVTATVPAAGARQGDRIDCAVSSVGSAKSLAGGRLYLTPLLGPNPKSGRVFALAEGPLTLDPENPTTARVHGGCRLEEDFTNIFSKDGKITLVLDRNHAGFQVAKDVAEMINSSELSYQARGARLAKALDQVNIEVNIIPDQYKTDLVKFVSQVLDLPLLEVKTVPRVVINERSGAIVIGGDVEIGACVVSHKNILIETGGQATGQFTSLDPSDPENAKLKALVTALNALHVSKADMVDVIRGLQRNGKLHAELIIE